MNAYTETEINEWVNHYLTCVLWSSRDYRFEADSDDFDPEAGESMDDSFSPDDIHADSLASVREDIIDFIDQCSEAGIDLQGAPFAGRAEWSAHAQHAHDLWLTRNHHGAGFWDRGYGEVGDRLTAIAHAMGSRDCYAVDSNSFAVE